jgi:hypothetical protein
VVGVTTVFRVEQQERRSSRKELIDEYAIAAREYEIAHEAYNWAGGGASAQRSKDTCAKAWHRFKAAERAIKAEREMRRASY